MIKKKKKKAGTKGESNIHGDGDSIRVIRLHLTASEPSYGIMCHNPIPNPTIPSITTCALSILRGTGRRGSDIVASSISLSLNV